MTPEQSTKIVDALRDNWQTPAWTQGRYNLFCEALAPYPYELATRAVGELLRRGVGGNFLRVEHVVGAIERAVDRRRSLDQQRRDRLAITGPKDPAVGELLRATIVRLEDRRRAGGGS